MLLRELAETSTAVADTSGRIAKVELLATCLRQAGPAEVSVAVAYLSGELPQRRTGLGYAALRDRPPPAEEPTLELAEVDAEFAEIAGLAGKGSTTARRTRFAALMARATVVEQRLLAGLISGDLRQGALDGVLTEAVATAAKAPAADVRRAVLVAGGLAPVAESVLIDGPAGLTAFQLAVGSPVRPMLATAAPTVAAALERTGSPAACEWKLDGVRLQIHRNGSDVAIFTRTLDDVTGRVPEVVDLARSLPVQSIVVDGEAIALGDDGRPLPFQRTASRIGSKRDVAAAQTATPLSVYLFDCLHLDGADLIGASGTERNAALDGVVPEAHRTPRLITDDSDAGEQFFRDALAQGHEGVVVKSLTAPYEAGRRGSGWVKVKPHHTLDLVIVAVEWGSGRRQGLLSNLHLAARDPAGRYGEPGGMVMLGKTFKGLTDAMLRWQTDTLLGLADGATDEWVVRVRPELVVEIAFDGVQRSPRYPAGMALRFARVVHHRPDKPAAEADTIDAVQAVFKGH